MRWLNRDIWKVGITLAGLLLFLVLMIWVPASSIGASERTSEPATPVTGTVQTTPTEDATVAALNKEKLKQEVEQLKEQNDATVIASNKQKLQDGNNWWWNYGATILSSVLSAVLIVGGGIFALLRWLDDRQKERQANEQKQEKERFESLSSVISGLGDEKERVRFGAATMLRSIFLRPGYEQFYRQVFDLAVGHLRLSSTSNPSEDPDGIPPSPEDPNTPLPLRQALIVVFKEAFPLARDKLKEEVNSEFSPQSLDASCVQLDNAYMSRADLKQAWMPQASLREADLSQADLTKANLIKANLSRTDLRKAKLSEAKLSGANLSRIPGTRVARPSLRGTLSSKTLGTLDETDLWKADLSGANLSGVNLSGAKLSGANLSGVNLWKADLSGAKLSGVNLNEANLLSEAKLSGADLSGADLSGANFGVNLTALRVRHFLAGDDAGDDLSGANFGGADLSGANLIEADLRGAKLIYDDLSAEEGRMPKGFSFLSPAHVLKDINLCGVIGLTEPQLKAYKAKDAIIDEDTMNSASQSSIPPASSQSNDAQAPSTPPA